MLSANEPICDWDKLLEELSKFYFKLGIHPVYPALSSIIDNIQTVWEVYRLHPETCIKILEQVVAPFSKDEYEQNVLAPMKQLFDQEPELRPLVASLETLRKFLGADPSFILSTFHREIELITGDNKPTVYTQFVNEACRKAIHQTVENINTAIQAKKTKHSL